jgi:hypothetical protein
MSSRGPVAGRLSEQSGSILNVGKRAYATISERLNSVADVIDGREAIVTAQSARLTGKRRSDAADAMLRW